MLQTPLLGAAIPRVMYDGDRGRYTLQMAGSSLGSSPWRKVGKVKAVGAGLVVVPAEPGAWKEREEHAS